MKPVVNGDTGDRQAAQPKHEGARLMLVAGMARQIQALIGTNQWSGPVTKLARLLSSSTENQIPPTRLAIWLRQNEPTLWWRHEVCIRFSRTGRQRLVHLARRPPLINTRL